MIPSIRVCAAACMAAVLFHLSTPRSAPRSETWTQHRFEAEIADAVAECRPVRVPGVVVLERSIDLRRMSGLRFQGTGMILNHGVWRGNDNFPNAATRIVWRGPPDQAIFVTAGTGNIWDGITFILDRPARACIHVVKASGIGSGKHRIVNCAFIENPAYRHSTVAVMAGTNIGDANCDCLAIAGCVAVDTRSLFMSHNHQSLCHTFTGNQTIRNACSIDLSAGGKHAVYAHACVTDGVFLRLGQQGSNNNRIEVSGLSVDNQIPNDADGNPTFLLIDNLLNKRVHVTISGKLSGRAAGSRGERVCNDQPTFDLSGLTGILPVPGAQ